MFCKNYGIKLSTVKVECASFSKNQQQNFTCFYFRLKLTLLFTFILFFIAFGASAQNSVFKKYDSLINIYRYSKPDSAQYFIKNGLKVANSIGDKVGKAMMLNQMGIMNDNRGKYPEAKDNYQEALKLYQSLQHFIGMATETYRLGVVEARTGKYDKAIAYHLKALELSEHIHDAHGIIEANVGLTDDYIFQRKFETGLAFLKTADSVNRKMPFSNLNLSIANGFGVVYREQGNFALAKDYVEKGLTHTHEAKYNGSFITLTNTLATIYTKEGNIAYAIKLQLQALQKSREIKNYLREMESLFNLAASYNRTSPKKSLNYLMQARDLAIDKKVDKQLINALDKMAGIYERLGNDKEALALRKQQYELADKLYYQEMSKEIAGLQYVYETNKSKLQLQQLQLVNNKTEWQQKIILAIAVASVIILIVIIIFYYQLQKVNSDLANTSHIKDKLLSVLAHDLRTPFISIINLLQFINDDDVTPEEKKELMGKLETGAKASLETLDSLLKWGQMQIKGLQINPIDLPIKPVIERSVQLIKETADQKHIELINLTGDDVSVHVDADQFEFIIRNLLSNAVKFTSHGGKVWIITVNSPDKRQATITVKDNGVGIAPEKVKNIFRLENVSTAGTTNEKGTSLGLLMCKEFAEANKGSIGVSSKLSEGSEFYLTLPVA